MTRKRTLSRGLLVPGDDESDLNAFFDEIVADGGSAPSAAVDSTANDLCTDNQTAGAEEPGGPDKISDPARGSAPDRRIPLAALPRRTVYEAGRPRDHDFFTSALEGLSRALPQHVGSDDKDEHGERAGQMAAA